MHTPTCECRLDLHECLRCNFLIAALLIHREYIETFRFPGSSANPKNITGSGKIHDILVSIFDSTIE